MLFGHWSLGTLFGPIRPRFEALDNVFLAHSTDFTMSRAGGKESFDMQIKLLTIGNSGAPCSSFSNSYMSYSPSPLRSLSQTPFFLFDVISSGVGKTCLLLRYANNSFSPTFITTIGIECVSLPTQVALLAPSRVQGPGDSSTLTLPSSLSTHRPMDAQLQNQNH